MSEAQRIVEDLSNELKAFHEQFKKKADESVSRVVGALFEEHPNLNQIEIVGYTPAFNDGDPCVHVQVVHHPDIYGDYSEDDGDPNPRLSDEERRVIEDTLDAFEAPLEKAFGTGWQLTWTRNENGSIDFERDEYDCGY